jgi:hypothetical protein
MLFEIDLFLSSGVGQGASALLGPLERASLSDWISKSHHIPKTWFIK